MCVEWGCVCGGVCFFSCVWVGVCGCVCVCLCVCVCVCVCVCHETFRLHMKITTGFCSPCISMHESDVTRQLSTYSRGRVCMLTLAISSPFITLFDKTNSIVAIHTHYHYLQYNIITVYVHHPKDSLYNSHMKILHTIIHAHYTLYLPQCFWCMFGQSNWSTVVITTTHTTATVLIHSTSIFHRNTITVFRFCGGGIVTGIFFLTIC